jgi:CO/xanthine dehydrogenase FAD-binding subunit
MDLNRIASLERPGDRRAIEALANASAEGDAWLAGGTWLFSEPQPRLRRLIDLSGLDWRPLCASERGLDIAATCTIAQLAAFKAPANWLAAPLIGQCCHAFLASFKIWNMATVGGNLCMALPAGPMISLCAALEGVCAIWTPDGDEREAPVVDFVEGPQQPALRPGEVLRSIALPSEALSRRTAFRRISLSRLGRSAALLVGALTATGDFALTVTASTRRPVRLAFVGIPDESQLKERLAAEIPESLYYDDIHGLPDWRRHMTFEFAGEIRRELIAGGPS